jgi:cytochrome b561
LIDINNAGDARCNLHQGKSNMLIYNSSKGYGAIPQTAHWLTVVLVAVAWTLGLFGDELPKGPQRDAGLFVHISAGLAVIILLVVRLAWNLFNPPPSAGPKTLGVWLARLGQAAHYLLYALLIAVPVVGIVLQFARGEPIPIFGLSEIASPWVKDRTFSGNVKEVHDVLAHTLVIVAGFHAAAALIHHWVLRDRTLARMLPRFGE